MPIGRAAISAAREKQEHEALHVLRDAAMDTDKFNLKKKWTATPFDIPVSTAHSGL